MDQPDWCPTAEDRGQVSQCEETQTVMGAVGMGTTQQWVDLKVLLEPRTIETRIFVQEAQKASCKNGEVIVAVLARPLWGVVRKPFVTPAVVTCGKSVDNIHIPGSLAQRPLFVSGFTVVRWRSRAQLR